MTGFADPNAARKALRRLRLRRALLDVQRSIPALLHILDQSSQVGRDTLAATVKRGVELADGQFQGRVGAEPIDHVEGDHMREQQLLQGMDLILQLLNSLNQGLAHGCFSAIRSNAHEATSAAPTAHRLSDEPSQT